MTGHSVDLATWDRAASDRLFRSHHRPHWAMTTRVDVTRLMAAARAGDLAPNTGARTDLAWLSCLPWLDFTHLDNAQPGPGDCIPRIAWGRFVQDPGGDRWTMALSIQVHHALADGRHVAEAVAAVRAALDAI